MQHQPIKWKHTTINLISFYSPCPSFVLKIILERYHCCQLWIWIGGQTIMMWVLLFLSYHLQIYRRIELHFGGGNTAFTQTAGALHPFPSLFLHISWWDGEQNSPFIFCSWCWIIGNDSCCMVDVKHTVRISAQ